MLKRRGTKVKADNVSGVFMQNIDSIQETVQEFQKMSEDTFKNDAQLMFQREKENYDQQIEKLSARIEKNKN